ncbi:hypothetical protein M8C21_001988 [Ambrosia artemisiifolia]|uniref:Uncharacterized protein n=1 Tax=Ambrosia artemisiifolia TaxID=4212 RepID=A0AAD5C198_AMBAR|nr:hypothetical protein M8C21_001988 [Ambrosia artemisiifolia]
MSALKGINALEDMRHICGITTARKKATTGRVDKGYRVISIDIPHVWNNHEWVQAFEKFLDVFDVHRVQRNLTWPV